jgi:hypothetical protein
MFYIKQTIYFFFQCTNKRRLSVVKQLINQGYYYKEKLRGKRKERIKGGKLVCEGIEDSANINCKCSCNKTNESCHSTDRSMAATGEHPQPNLNHVHH